jgi:amino acid adenylation domain-containing protein
MKNLLKELREHKIHISLQDENLKLKFDGAKPSSDLIAKIKEHKEALVTYLKSENKQQKSKETIPAIPVSEDGYKLSSAQNRLWILSQFEDGLPTYNITYEDTFTSENFNIERFKKSVFTVIERHEILRTIFKKNEEGEIRQFILPVEALDFEIKYIDFRKEENTQEAIENLMNVNGYEIFSLEKGPLFSAKILHLDAHTYSLYYTMHHIIGDGWSMGILENDVMTHYLSSEEKITPLKIQYKDYAAWQLSKVVNGDFTAAKNFWEQQLSGKLPILNLPSNLNRPALKTNAGQQLEMYLPEDATAALLTFTKENSGSLFMTLLSIWNILVYKYTGEKDIIIGAPVAGREHVDLENQIGFYVNTLALRNEITPKKTISEYYTSVKENTLSALSYQTYPFDLLVSKLNIPRDTSRNAVFDIMVALQNTGDKISDADLSTEPGIVYDKGKSLTKFDVEVNFCEIGSLLLFKVNFNTDVYEKELITQMMRHFNQLAKICVNAPNTTIEDIEFLTQAEQAAQIQEHNRSEVPFPKTKTIDSIFQETVEKYPNNVAISYQDTLLTYQELDAVSNQFAHYLQSKINLQNDDLIGIKINRSEWMIIAILGILKSGAAYVPIDPEYPEERIEYMKEDSACKMLIDEEIIEQFLNQKENFATAQPKNTVEPSSLAYVIYTSGTTGQPKGTLLAHKNVVRLLFNDEVKFDFTANDVWCLFHSYCFDFSVWEIFGALLHGGKLIIVPKETTRDTLQFAELLATENITVLNQTPTAFEMLNDVVVKNQTKLGVRYLIFGGEAFNATIVKDWKQHFPTCKIINMYGITETTVHVTYKEITETEIEEGKSNIGVPIPTLGVILLDENQKIVPKGVTGELCVYGEGLASGYLNKKEITQQKFITYEHHTLGKIKLYRSGDYAKKLPNNELSYMGRMDNQVKIRGHRIELGEIEHEILKIKEIKQCVVEVKTNTNSKSLIAYLVAHAQESFDKNTIKNQLLEKLPAYMVPVHYSILEEIPMTSNGKVNRKLLPNISENDIVKAEYVPPTSEIEETIVEIIKSTLGNEISEIGITDNFFDLGLDSFLLIKMLQEINSKLNFELKPLHLFQYPNIKSLIENVLKTEKEEESQLSETISEDMDSMLDLF